MFCQWFQTLEMRKGSNKTEYKNLQDEYIYIYTVTCIEKTEYKETRAVIIRTSKDLIKSLLLAFSGPLPFFFFLRIC